MDTPAKTRLTSWLVIGVAGVAVLVTALYSAMYPMYGVTGFDWSGFVAGLILLAVPLLLVGLALRSPRRGVARATAIIAPILAAILAAILLGHAFWGHDWIGYSAGQKVLDVLSFAPPIAAYLAVFFVEIPSFTKGRPIART